MDLSELELTHALNLILVTFPNLVRDALSLSVPPGSRNYLKPMCYRHLLKRRILHQPFPD